MSLSFRSHPGGDGHGGLCTLLSPSGEPPCPSENTSLPASVGVRALTPLGPHQSWDDFLNGAQSGQEEPRDSYSRIS